MKSLEYCNPVYNYKTWQVMQEYMPKGLAADYSERFRRFDPKSSGVVKIEDVSSILGSLGRRVSTQEVQKILGILIGEHNMSPGMDYVDFKEYILILSVFMTECVSEDEMYMVFRQFDQDGDGYITSDELRQLLLKFGEEVSDDDISDMIKEADLDGDGRVSYGEFIRVMTNSEIPDIEKPDYRTPTAPEENLDKDRSVCRITVSEASDTESEDERTDVHQAIHGQKQSHNSLGTDINNSRPVHRVRSFSLNSAAALKPPPVQHRRKISLGDLLHLPSSGKRKNSRQENQGILQTNRIHRSVEHIDHKDKESKRRFSTSGVHLKQMFKRKQKNA